MQVIEKIQISLCIGLMGAVIMSAVANSGESKCVNETFLFEQFTSAAAAEKKTKCNNCTDTKITYSFKLKELIDRLLLN